MYHRKDIASRIDKAVQDAEAVRPQRTHLGASEVGGECLYAAWASFRKFITVNTTGRMLRVYGRGHGEEHVMNKYLRLAGYEVRDYSQRLLYHDGSDSYVCIDWDDTDDRAWAECDDVSEDPVHIVRATERRQGPRQWHFEDPDSMGHYSGSSDGRVRGPLLPEGWGGLEQKTSNFKSFSYLTKHGVEVAKPVHFNQMQQYMLFFGLQWSLYMVVNKNDDEYYFEVVYANHASAGKVLTNARHIVRAQTPPPRVTTNPAFYKCKFCDFREICHYGEAPEKNCRSCIFAQADVDKSWKCTKFDQTIPPDFIPKGCGEWKPIKT